MNPLPHRVTFLAPVLVLPPGWERVEEAAAELLEAAVFEHLVRHPKLSVTDPDDFLGVDPDGTLVNIRHPNIENVIDIEIFPARRAEVAWFELEFVAPSQTSVRLKVRGFDTPEPQDFSAVGAPLSDLVAGVLAQWLGARGLGSSPKAIEAFTDGDLLNASLRGADLIAAAQRDVEQAKTMLGLPDKLKIPYCHLAARTLGIGVERTVLDLEADNPWGLRDDHLARWHSPSGAPRDELRRIVALAPGWAKPWGLMWGKGVNDVDRVYWYSINAALAPANPFALGGYADALRETGRRPEAFRLYDRATRLYPRLLTHQNAAMQVARELSRPGMAYVQAIRRMSKIDDLLEAGVFGGAEPDMCFVRLALSDVMFDLGRLAEATHIRDRALSLVFNPDQWPRMRGVLDKWRTDPVIFAQAYAREGYYRGDYGRAVKGSPKGEIDDYSQLALFVDSLLVCGKERLALLAWAHYARRTPGSNTGASLEGAKAFLANGLLEPAVEILAQAELRGPQHLFEMRVDRLLRLGAAFEPREHEAVVARWLDRGARTIAKRMARNAADFVEGAASEPTIARLLATPAAPDFDLGRLSLLRAAVAEKGVEAIDQFFSAATESSLVAADRLIQHWPELAPKPAEGASDAEQSAYTSRLVYVFGQALSRYLATSGRHPGPLAGAFRTIAGEALAAMHVAALFPSTDEVRGVFEAIEPYLAADPWVGEPWVGRIERMLDLEDRYGGHVDALVESLPNVASAFRGDEVLGTVLRAAQDAAKQGDLPTALALYPRVVRSVGGNFASAWAEAVTAGLARNAISAEDAVDALFVAYFANPNAAGAAVELAKLLLPRRPDVAFEVLSERLGWASGDWKKNRLAELAPLWPASLGVPFAFDQASSQGYLALQQGRIDEAVKLHRWCDALDAGNATILRNLALAYAQLGDTFRTVSVLSEADAIQGPLQAAQQLFNAGKHRQAMRAFEYACLGNVPPVAFQQWAGAAYSAEDDEATVEAYEAFSKRVDGNLDGPSLNAYAGSLDNLGRHEECETIARKLLEVAGNDAALASNAWHHYACSLLGRQRFPEAVDAAQRALQMNPLPENLATFQETLQRAQSGQPRSVTPSRSSSPEGRAFRALLESDVPKVAELARIDVANHALGRAALAATELRTEAENDVRVTDRCAQAALAMLDRTAGANEPDAILGRLHAMRIREHMLFAIDPVPKMGTRPAGEELERLFPTRPAPGTVMSAAGDPDPEVLPGTKLARLSQYVTLLKGMQAGDFQGALKRAGLDMGTYGPLAAQWGQKLQQDPGLAAKFQKMMSGG